MLHRSARLVLALLVFGTSCVGWSARIEAATTIRAISCQSCANLTQLQTAAQNTVPTRTGGQYPQTTILVVSRSYPISAYFKTKSSFDNCNHQSCPAGPWVNSVTAITATNDATAILDNQIFARASKIEPIHIPASIGPSVTQVDAVEFVQSYVNGIIRIAPGAAPGTSIWHGLTSFPNFVFLNFYDTRKPGEVFQVFTGDTLTVVFSDKSSVQLKFIGPAAPSGQMFQWVYGSERDSNGRKLSNPNTTPAIPGPGTSTPLPWTPDDATVVPSNTCSVVSTQCSDGDNAGDYLCTGSVYDVPC